MACGSLSPDFKLLHFKRAGTTTGSVECCWKHLYPTEAEKILSQYLSYWFQKGTNYNSSILHMLFIKMSKLH